MDRKRAVTVGHRPFSTVLQFWSMKKTKTLVVGNWKLNPGTVAEAQKLTREVIAQTKKLVDVEIVVAPPFLFIPEVSKITGKSNVKLAAQDAHYEERGACTGEISPVLLSPYGVTYVIVGHSERRALGETDEQVNKKIQTLLKRKMTPIVCIGEKERDSQGNFYNHIEKQIHSLTAHLTAVQVTQVIIAYEPIWAIGTGKVATVEDVKEMQLFIMSVLAKLYDRKTAIKICLLYGGSVKPSNAKELTLGYGMNGFLVGGASLQAMDFTAIASLAVETKNK